MAKLVLQESTNSVKYLLIDRAGNLHVVLPLVSGCTIGMDNTCRSTRALQEFFIDDIGGRGNKSVFSLLTDYRSALSADLELLKAHNLQNTLPYTQKLMRLDQVNYYIALLDYILLVIIDEARIKQPIELRGSPVDLQQALWYYPAFLSSMMTQANNLFAIHLNPQTPYGNLRTTNPTFTSCGALGGYLREQFANNSNIRTSLAQLLEKFDLKRKIKQLIESKFPEKDFNFNELIAYITEQLSPVSKTGAINLTITARGDILDEERVKAVTRLDEITATDVFNFVAHSCLAPDFWLSTIDTPAAIISLYDADEQIDKLCLLMQFYLAHINIYCAANNLSKVNFGLAFDNLVWLRWKLFAEIKKSLAEDVTQVSKNIFNFINSKAVRSTLHITRELTEADYEAINAIFLSQYKTAMQSDHPDEFIIFLPGGGPFANYQNNIATSFSKAFLTMMALRRMTDHSPLMDFVKLVSKNFDDEVKLASGVLENQSQVIVIEHLFLSKLIELKEISETNDVQLGIEFINNLIADPAFADKQADVKNFIWQQGNKCFLKKEYTKAKNCYTYALFCINDKDADSYYYKTLLRIRRIQCMALDKTARSTGGYDIYLNSEIGLVLCELRGLERFITTKNQEVIELYCYLLNLPDCSITEFKPQWIVKLIEYVITYQPEHLHVDYYTIKDIISDADKLRDNNNYDHAAILYRAAINSIITNKLWPSKIDGKELGLLNQRLGDCLVKIGKTEEAITAYDSAYEYFKICSARGVRYTQHKILFLTNLLSSVCSTPTGTSEGPLQAHKLGLIQGETELAKSTEELISSDLAAAETTVCQPMLFSIKSGQLCSTTNGVQLGTLGPIKTTALTSPAELAQKTRRRLFSSHST